MKPTQTYETTLSCSQIIARTPPPEYNSARASAQAFIVAEQIRTGPSQLALARAAARSAPEDPETAALVNRVQQLRDRWQAMTRKLTEEYERAGTQRDPDRLSRLQQQEATLGRQFQEANEQLLGRFPAYADLIAPDPIDPSTAAQLLDPDEALIAYLSLDDRLLAWLLRPGRSPVYRDIDVKRAELGAAVDRIRLSLDPNRPFDVIDAYGVYSEILKPFEQDLVGVKSLSARARRSAAQGPVFSPHHQRSLGKSLSVCSPSGTKGTVLRHPKISKPSIRRCLGSPNRISQSAFYPPLLHCAHCGRK